MCCANWWFFWLSSCYFEVIYQITRLELRQVEIVCEFCMLFCLFVQFVGHQICFNLNLFGHKKVTCRFLPAHSAPDVVLIYIYGMVAVFVVFHFCCPCDELSIIGVIKINVQTVWMCLHQRKEHNTLCADCFNIWKFSGNQWIFWKHNVWCAVLTDSSPSDSFIEFDSSSSRSNIITISSLRARVTLSQDSI